MAEKCGRDTRSGKPCQKYVVKGKTACKMHGGGSTGPKTEDGKERSSRNPARHWLYGSPKKFLTGLPEEVRAFFDAQVDEICKAEGVEENPLDRELVVSFVTACFMEQEARSYLLERGLISAEEWREISIKDAEGKSVLEPAKDIEGQQIREPIVNASLAAAYRALVKTKRELHAQLRAHTSKRGDLSPPLAADARRRLDEVFPMRTRKEAEDGA